MDGTLRSRFECKYLIPPQVVPAVRHYLQSFAQPDPYAARSPGFRYRISSLYLDSSDLQLYGTTVQGIKNRYKLRIRTYDDLPQSPTFFEVKKRTDGAIRKRRAKVPRELGMRFLDSRLRLRPGEGSEIPDFQEFRDHCQRTQAAPLIRVRYWREAYESTGKDPVRITFDTELMHQITLQPDLRMHCPGWLTTPIPGTILEIKFTDLCPSWVLELIRTFQLQKQSVAKYILSVDRAIELGNYQPMLHASFTGLSASLPSSPPPSSETTDPLG
ncbi:MAG: VTC domain-containing protein [Planctomycetota bacterium]|nr:MAG: VTC domain-containing protein [Planctomycetota bacterium]